MISFALIISEVITSLLVALLFELLAPILGLGV